jgi:preprotein translocase subunit SecA
VTFCTRGYGRGTDFICNDTNVDKEGGVHVILTFKPEDYSEEVQIMGRTARQSNKGSFQIIVHYQKLEKFLAMRVND